MTFVIVLQMKKLKTKNLKTGSVEDLTWILLTLDPYISALFCLVFLKWGLASLPASLNLLSTEIASV